MFNFMLTLPWHAKLVHLPIALAVLLPLLSAGVLLAWWRGWLDRRAWVIVAALQLCLVGSAYAAMWSGEREEDRVERIVPEAAIEAHEAAAEQFFWATGVAAALGVAAIVVPGERWRRSLATGSVVAVVVVLGLGVRVGQAGGELVYRHNAAAAYAEPAPNSVPGE